VFNAPVEWVPLEFITPDVLKKLPLKGYQAKKKYDNSCLDAVYKCDREEGQMDEHHPTASTMLTG